VSGIVAGERLDLSALSVEALRGRRVAVLGFARSGLAAARFLADAGALVTVYDVRPREELLDRIDALEGRQVALRLGPRVDPGALLGDRELIVTSPSVSSRYPTTEPRLRAALAAAEAEGRAPVVSEVDLFLRLCPATTIGVTGTKGKTTTASLIAAVLESDGAPTWLGGNIGRPLIDRVGEMGPGDRVVVELSELQLPTLSRGTDVAVYTNVTADHLDRHGSVGAYRAAKARLAELTRERRGLLVLNGEDPFVAALARPGDRVVRYGRSAPTDGGVGVLDGWVTAAGSAILPLDEIPLPGAHNLSNVLAAVAAGIHFAIPGGAIRRAVAGFPGVEHRLETVATVDGIRYVNDSQGTQPDAVIAALRAFEPPIVLIAGGREKGVDLTGLAAEVAGRAHGAVLIGEAALAFERLFAAAGLERIERAEGMEDAVRAADRMARATRRRGGPPATVLLSPAAASFDMFEDYEARGRAFKEAVARVVGRDTR